MGGRDNGREVSREGASTNQGTLLGSRKLIEIGHQFCGKTSSLFHKVAVRSSMYLSSFIFENHKDFEGGVASLQHKAIQALAHLATE